MGKVDLLLPRKGKIIISKLKLYLVFYIIVLSSIKMSRNDVEEGVGVVFQDIIIGPNQKTLGC